MIDLETSVTVDCTTAPDIDEPDWEDWFRAHWSMPYVDWMPLQRKVTEWLMYNVPTNWNEPS